MNRLLKAFIAMSILLPSTCIVHAENNDGTNEQPSTKKNIKKDIPVKKKDPINDSDYYFRSPMRIILSVEITTGAMLVEYAAWFEEMDVTLTNVETGEIWTGYISSDNQIISFDGGCGSYIIECITSDNLNLTGVFEI